MSAYPTDPALVTRLSGRSETSTFARRRLRRRPRASRWVRIDAVRLRGGACDGDRPNPPADSEFPDNLTAMTVMDPAWVGHVYGVALESIVDETGVRRRVFEFERTVDADAVREGAQADPPA